MDDWLTVLLLNALSDGPYDWLQKELITFMTNSKVQLLVKDIIERIEAEAREVCNSAKREDTTLAAKASKGNTSKKQKSRCTTCKRTDHTTEACWKIDPSKAPEWFKKQGKSGDKANLAGTDSGSESAAVKIDTELTSIMFKDRPYDGYLSCVALENPENTSIQPNEATKEHEQLLTVIDHTPFFLDSSATSHCSPVCSDFADFKMIEKREIQGVSGTTIPAIGRGTIHLKCRKGRTLILCEALIQSNNNKIIANGSRKGQGLYVLNGKKPCINHVHISRVAPMLKTWHCHLGHMNYNSTINMTKNALVT
ncbi:hypothetical protein K439DRAFT_1640817, partial [Ramaria rubella]